jgi:hypothetical protein
LLQHTAMQWLTCCCSVLFLVPGWVYTEYLLKSFSAAEFPRANATGTGDDLPAFLPGCHSYNHHAYICITHTFLSLRPLLPFCYLHSKKDIEVSILPYIASSWAAELFVSSLVKES